MTLATVPMTGAFAAALDRSGQSISPFLQAGNYFEAGISALDADVSGAELGTDNKIGDMADSYYFPSAALKIQVNDKFSFGLLYDQPFGAKAKYSGDNIFVSNENNTILSQPILDQMIEDAPENRNNVMGAVQQFAARFAGTPLSSQNYAYLINAYDTNGNYTTDGTDSRNFKEDVDNAIRDAAEENIDAINGLLGTGATEVDVHTQNLAWIFGFQPTKNLNLYAGPVYQTIKGDVKLRGQAYSLFNGYDASIKETGDFGWLAGIAYQIPEIALKASLTYRSEIDHDVTMKENISALNALALLELDPNEIRNAKGKTRITTPQSVNFDFQTGIAANTVAFANVRWVEWSDFSIRPYKFGLTSEAVGELVGRPNGFNLVEYSDDQWSATVGVGRKLSEKWGGNVSVGWDSGAGNPVSTLGPTEGYWSVGLGAQYSPAANYFIQAGVKYFMLGDAKAQTGAQAGGDEYVAKFKDNDAWGYGLKIGYKF